MNPNFYHWHTHAEFKPDVAILEPRWDAAVKFSDGCSPAEILSLLRLVLFSGAESEFALKFSEALVILEPTFPPERNAEMLRVMAAAALSNKLGFVTNASHAIALGMRAANFPHGRIKPVCQDIVKQATAYLRNVSEKIRPSIYLAPLKKAEKDAESYMEALKTAATNVDIPALGAATQALGAGVLAAMKESHEAMGKVIGRLTEESQFLWWLIGRRSPALDIRREQLVAEVYAFPAASEAAERVTLLLPSESVESLIDEALTQCRKTKTGALPLIKLIDSADSDWLEKMTIGSEAPEFTPITCLLAERKKGCDLGAYLKKFGIPAEAKFTPSEVSQQYFRELTFIRALKAVK